MFRPNDNSKPMIENVYHLHFVEQDSDSLSDLQYRLPCSCQPSASKSAAVRNNPESFAM